MTEKDNDEMTVCSADQHCLIVSPSSSIWLYPFSISYVIFGLKILWSKGCCGAVCAWSCLVSSWVTSYRYCGNTMMIKIIIPTWNSQGIPQPQWPDKGERAVIGTGNRGGCNAKKFEKARARIHGARSNDSSPQKVRRAYVKDEKPVALMFLMQKGCQTTPPCPTSPHRKVVFASLRHPCRCLLRAQVCGQAGVALWLCKGHKVLLQLFTFLLLCFVFLLIHRPASCTVSLYWAKKGGVLFCNWYYWAQGEYLHGFAEFWTIFSSSQRKKQKNNQTTSSSLSFLQIFISKLFFPTGWLQGSFIMLPDPGLLPAVCSSLKCLWGFFCCHYSSMAACQLPEALSFLVTTLCWLHALCLAKLNLLVKMRYANLLPMLGNQSFPFAVNT